jgi:hypothetical protein
MIHHVKEIIKAEPFKLTLRFNTGETLAVDLEKRLRAKSTSEKSLYKMLLDPEYFKQVKLQPEVESIYWENGLDFCPDVLYMMAKNIPFKHNDEK